MSKVTVTTHTFPKAFSELVLHEMDPRYSRKTVRIAPQEKALPFGMVLALTADGTYTPLTETEGVMGDPRVVLLSPVEASATAQSALALRGFCIVSGGNLVFDESITDKAAAFDALEDRGFIVKEIPSEVNDDAA